MKLSEAQQIALKNAARSMLVSAIPDKTETDCIGSLNPGMRTYKTLEKQGLLLITDEDPIDIDGEAFYPTPAVCLTQEGERLLSHSSDG